MLGHRIVSCQGAAQRAQPVFCRDYYPALAACCRKKGLYFRQQRITLIETGHRVPVNRDW